MANAAKPTDAFINTPTVQSTRTNSLLLDLALSPSKPWFGVTSNAGMLPTHRPRPRPFATPKLSHDIFSSVDADYNMLSSLDAVDDGKRYLAPERVAISRPSSYTSAPKHTPIPLPAFKHFFNENKMTWNLPQPKTNLVISVPDKVQNGSYTLCAQPPASSVAQRYPVLPPLKPHACSNVATHGVLPTNAKLPCENLPTLREFMFGLDNGFLNGRISVQAPVSPPVARTHHSCVLPPRFMKNRMRFGPTTTAMDLVRDYLLPPHTPDEPSFQHVHVGCFGGCSGRQIGGVAVMGNYGKK